LTKKEKGQGLPEGGLESPYDGQEILCRYMELIFNNCLLILTSLKMNTSHEEWRAAAHAEVCQLTLSCVNRKARSLSFPGV
jgi:hypothetical protein